MTQHNLNGHVINAVEIEKDAQSFSIITQPKRQTLSYEHSIVHGDRGRTGYIDGILLPPGSWQILGRPKEISEEAWKGLVVIQEVGYYDYEDVYCVGYFETALESGLSWCRANGIDEENSLLIIKNK